MDDGKKKIKIKGIYKSAVLLILLGEDYASKVFKKLNKSEIKILAEELNHLDKITPEVFEAVAQDFIKRLEGDTSIIIEGDSYLKSVLQKSIDGRAMEDLYKEIGVEERQEIKKPFEWSKNISPRIIAEYLKKEHPQTIAMILSYLPPTIASDVLSMISEEVKGEIALRIVNIAQISDNVVNEIDETLKKELGRMGEGKGRKSGINILVDILNGVDKTTEDTIMEALDEENSELGINVRNMMFVFEDLVRIDDRSMRELLKVVDQQILVHSLKTASEALKQKIFANLSMRASEMVQEDLELIGPLRLSEVEEAQQSIINSAKELEEEGTIVIGQKGKDEVLV